MEPRGPPSKSLLDLIVAEFIPLFDRQSRKRSGSFRQHLDIARGDPPLDLVPGRGHSYWMEDEEVGRVYGGPCKAATEHEAAGAGGRGLARALGRLLPR